MLLINKAINGHSPSLMNPICLVFVAAPILFVLARIRKLLQVLRSKLKSSGDKRFSIGRPILWTSIPAYIRTPDSLNSFKEH